MRSVEINDDPLNDNDAASKKYVDNLIDDATIVRYNAAFDRYLQVRVGNDTYNLQIYNKTQIIDVFST